MPAKAGVGRREATAPGPGSGWFRSRERIKCVPFDAPYAALTAVEAPSCRWIFRFHCCRYPVVRSGLSVLGDAGATTPPPLGNGLLSVNKEACVGKYVRTLK